MMIIKAYKTTIQHILIQKTLTSSDTIVVPIINNILKINLK
jgi:hypothetical protein